MDDANLHGEVQIAATAEEGDYTGNEMDVQEMGGMELVQVNVSLLEAAEDARAGENAHRDDVSLMQREVGGEFATVLQDLLQSLDSMPKLKAARIAHFLQDMLKDPARMAPHLRNPTLRARAEQLQALVSVFLEQAEQVQEDEQEWCLREWQLLVLSWRADPVALRLRKATLDRCPAVPYRRRLKSLTAKITLWKKAAGFR